MQQSGGLLLAAGLDGGNTMIFAAGENATNPIIHPIKIKDTFSGILYFYSLNGNRKAVKKTCRWHVFRPWENPGVSMKDKLSAGAKTPTAFCGGAFMNGILLQLQS